jgi:hypothetical protein
MGKNERQAYLRAIRSRYRRARKKVKVTILDEFCSVCRYNRKYAIRLLNQRAFVSVTIPTDGLFD